LRTAGALGPPYEFENAGNMTEVGDPVVPGGQVDGVADKTAGGGKGKGGEAWNGDEDGSPALADVERSQSIDLALPVRFFGEGELGRVRERPGEFGVPLADELGKQLVADAVAGEIQRRVGGIFAPGNAAVAEEANDLRAFDVDQRADDAMGCNGSDGSQPGGSAAAQEAKENGFGLVGACVAERDARRKSTSQVSAEKGIAGIAGGLLEIARGGREIELVESERKIECGGEGADEFGVAAGSVAAQIVIDVHDAKGQIPPGGEFQEDVEEADRVGAAGDRDGNAIARGEHAMALDGMDDSV
jgi:hypothetical protein